MTYPTNQIPSTNPQNIMVATPVGCEHNPRDPNAQDNTFPPGWEWQNTVTKIFFKCQSSTIAGAVWVPFAGAGVGTIVTLTANSGGAVNPDGMGNINVVGDGTTVNIIGNPGTNTLTASLVGGSIAIDSFTTNVSGPVFPDANGNIFVDASSSTYTSGAVANTLKTEVQGINHAIFVGRGIHSPATTIATGTAGNLLVSKGNAIDPAFAVTGPQLNASGYLTNAFQPAFFATQNSTVTNATGDGTVYTVICDMVSFDQASNYSNVTGLFTAPIDGRYMFSACVDMTPIVAASNVIVQMVVTGSTYFLSYSNPFTISNLGTYLISGTVGPVTMTSGSTAALTITVSGGTKTVNIVGQSSPYTTWFGGHLVC